MGYHELAFAFTDIPVLFQRNDDDLYDRMSHRWTAAQLILFALVVTTSQYVGDPIHCWVPAHFHGSWEKFSDSYCWMKNTYYLPFEDEVHKDLEIREKHPIVYYQWVQLILLLQALMFYLPIVLWRQLNNDTGMDMNDIIETSEKVQKSTDFDHKNKLLKFLAIQTHRYLGMARLENKYGPWNYKTIMRKICGAFGKKYGNYVSGVYVFIKLMFLANVIGQLWMMNYFLGQDYASYGIEVATAMWYGQDWTQSGRFPRVTMCDIPVRRLGNIQRYTVQCVLTINLFNEKIYLYLWFWFLLVAAYTVIGLVLYLARTFAPNDRHRYIEKHILQGHLTEAYDPDSSRDREVMDRFVNKYLRYDGVLLMRLVGHNTNKATVTDLLCACYEHYTNLPHIRKGIEAAAGDDDTDTPLLPPPDSTDSSFG